MSARNSSSRSSRSSRSSSSSSSSSSRSSSSTLCACVFSNESCGPRGACGCANGRDAAAAAGFPVRPHFNSSDVEGCGYFQVCRREVSSASVY